jgi:hypothetical protein
MKKIKQLLHKIYLIINKKRSNKPLIEEKNLLNKPDSNKVVRNKHGFPSYIID